MSIAETRQWIANNKRKADAVARWDGALEDTRVCAAEASRAGSGFVAANVYYNCRKGKKLHLTGLFNVPPAPAGRYLPSKSGSVPSFGIYGM